LSDIIDAPLLTPEQVALARVAKQRYLACILALLISNLLAVAVKLAAVQLSALGVVLSYVGVPLLIALVIFTWQFGRAMAMGIPAVIGTILVSILFWFIGTAILLRVYRKRTGIPISFLLADKG